MKRRLTTRRWFLVATVGLLGAWEPVPISLHVINASWNDVKVRISGTEQWIEVKAGAEVSVGGFNYAGLCNPPDRWLPEDFAGLEFELAGGSVVAVSREAFERDAEHDRGWTYRFRG